MTVVTTQDVIDQGNLIPLAEARNLIGGIEPVQSQTFNLDGSDQVVFDLPSGWNAGEKIRGADPSFVTDCSVLVSGHSVKLTKEALLAMTSAIGLTKDYVLRTPGELIQPHLNWWVKNGGVKGADQMTLLSKEEIGLAFVKSSLVPFSNVELLDAVTETAMDVFKVSEEDLWVDSTKLQHSLQRTALRVVIPAETQVIKSARNKSDSPDRWSLGVQMVNSLMADPESRLSFSGYLFAWQCSNGMISHHAHSGAYNRRSGQSMEEVLDWSKSSVTSILQSLEPEFSAVQALTEVSLTGVLNETLADVFKEFSVPRGAQQTVIDRLVESDDLTGYGLQQAITSAANDLTLSDQVRTKLMVIGGQIPESLTGRCDACHRVKVS